MTKLTEKDYNDILFEIRRFINSMEDKSLSVTRDLKSVTIGELEKKANGIFNDIQTLRAYLWTKKAIDIDRINSETSHNNDFKKPCLECKGTGTIKWGTNDVDIECSRCKGQGFIKS